MAKGAVLQIVGIDQDHRLALTPSLNDAYDRSHRLAPKVGDYYIRAINFHRLLQWRPTHVLTRVDPLVPKFRQSGPDCLAPLRFLFLVAIRDRPCQIHRSEERGVGKGCRCVWSPGD